MLAVRGVNATDPTYLRCAAGMVADPGMFLIIGIDPDRHLIRFTERGVQLRADPAALLETSLGYATEPNWRFRRGIKLLGQSPLEDKTQAS